MATKFVTRHTANLNIILPRIIRHREHYLEVFTVFIRGPSFGAIRHMVRTICTSSPMITKSLSESRKSNVLRFIEMEKDNLKSLIKSNISRIAMQNCNAYNIAKYVHFLWKINIKHAHIILHSCVSLAHVDGTMLKVVHVKAYHIRL